MAGTRTPSGKATKNNKDNINIIQFIIGMECIFAIVVGMALGLMMK